MKIESITLYLVGNRFVSPWRTAYGEDAGNCTVLAKLVSGGHVGWGESSPFPTPNYSPEYGYGAYTVAKRFLVPLLLGKEFTSAKEVNAAFSAVRGNPFAKAALEIAFWTLEADRKGVTLGTLLGASEKAVEVGDSWGIADSYDTLIANIGRSFDAGYRRVKLKIAPGWDWKMLQTVRSVFPNQTIHVDANACYRYEDDAEMLRGLDKLHLAMIEQPFACGDLYHHALLQKSMDTPICLDESITEPYLAEIAVETGACRYINIKPARVGGLYHTLLINDVCRQAGIGCWIGGMLETDIGKSILVEAAGLPGMTYSHDITPASITYVESISKEKLALQDGCMLPASTHVGTPIPPDEARLCAGTIESASWNV